MRCKLAVMGSPAKSIVSSLVALVCFLGVTSQVAYAQELPVEPTWSEDFWLRGFDDPVSATVVAPDGTLFVGGEFTAHDGQPMNYIAQWDGQAWSSLGTGLDGPVWSMAIDSDGSLVVGGYFNRAGNVAAAAVARWDGEVWSGFADGLGDGKSAVSSITFDATGQLVVAQVVEAYDEPYRGFFGTDVVISAWDGSVWSAMGEPRSITQTDTRPQLTADENNVLISSAGPSLSAWDGTAWVDVGPDMPTFNWAVRSLRTTPSGQVLVVDIQNTIYQWFGGEWSEFSTLEDEALRPTDIIVRPSGDIYLAAEQSIPTTPERNQIFVLVDGQWEFRAEVEGGDIAALGWFDSKLLAHGSFNATGNSTGRTAAFLAVLDQPELPAPPSWLSLGAEDDAGSDNIGFGLDGTVHDIVVASNGDAYVAGGFAHAGGVVANGIAKWDGQQWSSLAGGTNGVVASLAIDSHGDLIAGGYFSQAGDVPVADIARWDGSAWNPIGTGFARPENFGLSLNVEALATGAGGVIYASGYFETSVQGTALNGIARWDGVSWQPLGEGLEGLIQSLALGPDGSLVAAGSISNGVVRWDGQRWSSLGSRFVRFDPITDIAVKPDGTIVAAGSFDGNFGVAHWSGIDWVRLGPPVIEDGPSPAFELPWEAADFQDVYALEIDSSGGVLAGGRFRDAGGQVVNHLVRWDGRGWKGYGQGLDGAVTALAFGQDDQLVIGGRFVNAGGVPAARITTLSDWREPFVGLIAEASTLAEIVNATDYDPEVHGEVLRLYQAFFHREPDVGGAKYWIGLNGDGYEIDAISKFFEATDEFNNNYAEATNEEFLGAIYLNVLGRSHDVDGFEYWLNLLETDQLTRGDVVRWIAANEEFINRFPYGMTA